MRSVLPRRAIRPAASLLVLAGFAGAGCSGDVTRFASLSPGVGMGGARTAYEASPQAAQPGATPSQYPTVGRNGQLPPPPQTYAAAPSAAPVQVASAAPAGAGAATTANPGTHVVAPGDNLWGLARRYDTTRAAIAAKNGLSMDATLRVGQSLAIPQPGETTVEVASAAPAVQPEQAPAVAEPAPVEIETPAVEAPVQPAPTEVAVTAPEPTSQAAPKTDMAATEKASGGSADEFRWPVRGRVISEFGSKPDGQKNDGINLVVPEGTPVKASRDGEVIYAGSELEGYGNLVLVRHPGNWVTAYAHNSELLVKRGDQVRRGQPVAKAGRSGSVSFPQVHFEIRKGATPVDPMTHLKG